MSAHDDEPVVIRMPFAVACELEGYLAVLTDIHADTLLEGGMIVYASRMTRALAAVREGCARSCCQRTPVQRGAAAPRGVPGERRAPVLTRTTPGTTDATPTPCACPPTTRTPRRWWPCSTPVASRIEAGEVDGTDAATLRRGAPAVPVPPARRADLPGRLTPDGVRRDGRHDAAFPRRRASCRRPPHPSRTPAPASPSPWS